ncbi:MAG: hypothetical protein LBG59_00005 [Candidatus Peribacteria bacterium]|nr:hypothetical protein [Candidatus Peribacteria bacterium]
MRRSLRPWQSIDVDWIASSYSWLVLAMTKQYRLCEGACDRGNLFMLTGLLPPTLGSSSQ